MTGPQWLKLTPDTDRITVEVYRDPPRMVDEISALGLRHVGYGIPTVPWRQKPPLKDSGFSQNGQLEPGSVFLGPDLL